MGLFNPFIPSPNIGDLASTTRNAAGPILAKLLGQAGGTYKIPGTPSPAPRTPGTMSGSISPGVPRQPSIEDILRRLEELQDSGRYMSDLALLEQQARSSSNAQYDPIISELMNQMSGAQTRAGQNKVELGRMFGSLSNSLQEDIPEITQFYDQARQQTSQGFQGLQDSIQGQYDKSRMEQEELYKRLNIEAAAPDILPQQQRDRDYFTNVARTQGATADTAIGQEQRGAVDYTRRGSQIAQFEGTNRQADLMSQLESTLASFQGQIGAQNIAKQQAYQATLAELQTEMQKNAQSRAQADFDNYLKIIGIGRDLRSDERAGLEGIVVKSPGDVPTRVIQSGLPASSAQRIQDIFMSTLSNDPTILAGIDENFGQALPKEALAQRMVEAGRAAGLSQQELNVLQTAALEYFGRR